MAKEVKPEIGLIGLAVMGQNLALNVAQHGFPIAVYNRSPAKVDETVQRAVNEGNLPVVGYKDLAAFVRSLDRPRRIILLVKAGAPVDATLEQLLPLLEEGDLVVDGGNEWYENTERRMKIFVEKKIRYMGMGVSGGEKGARFGPALMPGGDLESYKLIESIVTKIAAQVDDGPCVSYIGPGGSGNYVKMVHNGIEYGDMQLIAEAYDILKRLGKLSNEELQYTFESWNKGALQSYLIEISADIFAKKDDAENGQGYLVDKILDSAGSKGTGMWTVQEAARRGVPCPTITSALDSRYISTYIQERRDAAKVFPSSAPPTSMDHISKHQLIEDVQNALYCSKICSYAQGMMLLQAASIENKWNLQLGSIARGWKGGCIIRAVFLDRIKEAFQRNPALPSLLVDSQFAKEIQAREDSWRRLVTLAMQHGVSVPSFSSSLTYFDSYRSSQLPLNLVQAQRDYFGSHTYQRLDREGIFHSQWDKK